MWGVVIDRESVLPVCSIFIPGSRESRLSPFGTDHDRRSQSTVQSYRRNAEESAGVLFAGCGPSSATSFGGCRVSGTTRLENMERVPRKIRAKEIVRDITAGVTDPRLMDKYELTPDQLEFLLQQLLNKGLVTQEFELDAGF